MNLAGLTGQGAKRVTQFLSGLANATSLRLHVDGKPTDVLIGEGQFEPDQLHLELAADLAFIEDTLNVVLAYPSEFPSTQDRIWIRVVRRILEGKASIMPRLEGVNFLLTGQPDQSLQELLAKDGAVMGASETWGLDVLGENLQLGDVSMLTPNALVVDSAKHIEAIARGDGAGRRLTLAAADGKAGVMIWSPSRIGDMSVLSPSPWGITGIHKHRQLRDAEH